MTRAMTHIAGVVAGLGPARDDLAEILAELQAVRTAYDEERLARARAEQVRCELQASLDASEEARLVAEEAVLMLEERIAGERAERVRERHAASLELSTQRKSLEAEIALLGDELRKVGR